MSRAYLIHNRESDAIYVRFTDRAVAKTVPMDDLRIVDYAADGAVVGVELLEVSEGVDLRGVPSGRTVAELLPEGVRVLAS